MLANISCAQSSGSTALSHMLDRHPEIVCGAEMFLFCHPLLYADYARFRRHPRLIRAIGLSGFPYSPNRALFRHLPDHALTKSQMWRWATESGDIAALAKKIQDHLAQLTGKLVWVEKTPWNIFSVGGFLRAFPRAKVIHLVRDPRDVILSLTRRDRQRSMLPAAQHWLTAVAMAQAHRSSANLLEIRYEDLCLNTEITLARICKFLDVSADPECFKDDSNTSRGLKRWAGHASWTSRPEAGFSSDAVGKYRQVDVDWSLLSDLRLTSEFAELIETHQWDLSELARSYQYDLQAAPRNAGYVPLPPPRRLDPFRRLLDHWMGLPGSIAQVEKRTAR